MPHEEHTCTALPMSVFTKIILLVVKEAPRDQLRLLGIPPGKLKLPVLNFQPASHTHGTGSATVTLSLPNFKEYTRQRVIAYWLPEGRAASPTGEQPWESCSLSIVRGHPNLSAIFDGEHLSEWCRTGDGDYVLDTDYFWQI